MCHASLGRPKDCVRAFEQARRLAPNDPDVLYNLGLAYEDVAAAGEGPIGPDEAIALYRRVLELAPSYQAARDRLKGLGKEADAP